MAPWDPRDPPDNRARLVCQLASKTCIPTKFVAVVLLCFVLLFLLFCSLLLTDKRILKKKAFQGAMKHDRAVLNTREQLDHLEGARVFCGELQQHKTFEGTKEKLITKRIPPSPHSLYLSFPESFQCNFNMHINSFYTIALNFLIFSRIMQKYLLKVVFHPNATFVQNQT